MDLSICCGLFQKGHRNQGPDSDRLVLLDSSDHITEGGVLSLVISFVLAF